MNTPPEGGVALMALRALTARAQTDYWQVQEVPPLLLRATFG